MARKNGNETMVIRAPHWEGDWVEVKKYITHGVERKVQAAMAQFLSLSEIDMATARNGETPDLKVNINMQALVEHGNDAQLLAMLVDWNFTDKQGNKLPLTQEGLDEVHEEDITYILAEIDKYNPKGVTQEQKDAFLQTPSSGSETSTTTSTLPLAG